MKKNTLLAYGAFALCSSLLSGQGTPTPPSPADMAAHHVSRLTALLTLTSAQQSQAISIFTTEETTISGLRSSIEAARKAIETAVEANDASSIATQSAQVGTLTGQEVQARATAGAAFYAILTAEQQTKFKAFQAAGPGGRMHGPGPGHGGPPPFEE